MSSLDINPAAEVVALLWPWPLSALLPRLVAIVAAKLGSSPRAADNSFNVSRVSGAESTSAATLVSV